MRYLAILLLFVGVASACPMPEPAATPTSTRLPPDPLLLVHDHAQILDEAGARVPFTTRDLYFGRMQLVQVQKRSGRLVVRHPNERRIAEQHYSISTDFAPWARLHEYDRWMRVESNAVYFQFVRCQARAERHPTFQRVKRRPEDGVIAVFPDGNVQVLVDVPCATELAAAEREEVAATDTVRPDGTRYGGLVAALALLITAWFAGRRGIGMSCARWLVVLTAVAASADPAHACPMRSSPFSQNTIFVLMSLVLLVIASGYAGEHEADVSAERL